MKMKRFMVAQYVATDSDVRIFALSSLSIPPNPLRILHPVLLAGSFFLIIPIDLLHHCIALMSL
jgi:hypothetical protein